MYQRIFFLMKSFAFWIVFFVLSKVLFLSYHYTHTSKLAWDDIAGIFAYGLRLDMSVAGYIVLLAGLFIVITLRFTPPLSQSLLKYYYSVILLIVSGLSFADIELYRNWAFRLDGSVFHYLQNLYEVIGSVDINILISGVAIYTLWIWFWSKIYHEFIDTNFEKYTGLLFGSELLLLLCTALFIIPIRGGLQQIPINIGAVYFHESNPFANHSAINVIWNIGFSSTHSDKIRYNKNLIKKEDKTTIINSLYPYSDTTLLVLKHQKPNVILIILESFTAKVVGTLNQKYNATPNLNQIAEEGILFTNFYASGDRTDKGIPAILNAYPAQTTTSILKFPKKTQNLPFLSKYLNNLNYKSLFLYGGELNFGNFRAHFKNGGFHQIIEKQDFSSQHYDQKWGVYDHVTAQRFYDELKNRPEPFFATWLTLSSHEPFDVPTNQHAENLSEQERFINSVKYTDECVGKLIDKLKNTSFWKNTLIIITADHGARHPDNSASFVPEKFHIPMIWTGGVLSSDAPKVISKYGSQTDIFQTLINQMNDSTKIPFSKDLFAQNTPSFAFYTFNNGYGFLNDTTVKVYDNIGKNYLISTGDSTLTQKQKGQALLVSLFEDFNNR